MNIQNSADLVAFYDMLFELDVNLI